MTDKQFFEIAYWRVIATIDAPKEQLSAMLPELFLIREFPKKKEVVRKYLPDGTWRWPIYDAFVAERDAEYYQDNLAEMKGYSLADMLAFLKSPQLRALQKEFSVGNEKNKTQMIQVLLSGLTATARTALTDRLRQNLIAEIDPPGTPDYKEMVVLLLRRISTIAYNLGREAQLRENAKLYPKFFSKWEFIAAGDGIPKKCRQMNGKKFHHDDPIWNDFPPCECLECACHIASAH